MKKLNSSTGKKITDFRTYSRQFNKVEHGGVVESILDARKLRFREANLVARVDDIVSKLNQGSSNPSQIKIKNKKVIFDLLTRSFHGMTLPLSMTGVKALTRLISSSLTLFFASSRLCLFLCGFVLRRIISVCGAGCHWQHKAATL